MSENSPRSPEMLLPEEIERYSRQLLLKGFGSREQLRLKQSSALVCDNPPSLLLYLAASGLGNLKVDGFAHEHTWLIEQARQLNPLIHVKSNENRALEPSTLAQIMLPAPEGKELCFALRIQTLGGAPGGSTTSILLESENRLVLERTLPQSVVGAADLALGAYAALIISQQIISHPN